MFCSKCGNNLPDNAKFCDKCGENIKNTLKQAEDSKKPVKDNYRKGIAIYKVIIGILFVSITFFFIIKKVENITESTPEIISRFEDKQKLEHPIQKVDLVGRIYLDDGLTKQLIHDGEHGIIGSVIKEPKVTRQKRLIRKKTYDQNDKLVEVDEYDIWGNTVIYFDKNMSHAGYGEYKYDDEGRMLEGEFRYKSQEKGDKTIYTYNEQGLLVKIARGSSYNKKFVYDSEEKLIKYETNTDTNPNLEYDNEGRVIKATIKGKYKIEYEYEYDDNGKLKKSSEYRPSTKYSNEYRRTREYTYSYDEYGNIVEVITIENGKVDRIDKYEYQYNDAGQILKIDYKYRGQYEIKMGYDINDREYKYEYDENGNIRKIYANDYYTSYDEYGNVLEETYNTIRAARTVYEYLE